MDELKEIVRYYAGRDIPILVPGVGSQGGNATDVMLAMKDAGYDASLSRINSSSGLTHPWKKGPAPEDWLDQCIAGIRDMIEKTRIG